VAFAESRHLKESPENAAAHRPAIIAIRARPGIFFVFVFVAAAAVVVGCGEKTLLLLTRTSSFPRKRESLFSRGEAAQIRRLCRKDEVIPAFAGMTIFFYRTDVPTSFCLRID
jgi:hypothetical protein